MKKGQNNQTQLVSILNKPISLKEYVVKFLNTSIFSIPGLLPLFYFLLVFLLAQILWLPVGAAIVLIHVLLIEPIAQFFHFDIMKIVDSSSSTQELFSIIYGFVIMIPVFIFSLWLLTRLSNLREQKLPKWLLSLIGLVSVYLSYHYYLYSIRDWWFIN